MPRVIEYSTVLETLQRQGFRSLYFNSGAFGFATGVSTISRGWIGPADPSIRESALPIVRQVQPPCARTLASLLITVWQTLLPGNVWVMPKSHWAYELEFGSHAWLPHALDQIGIRSQQLIGLNHAAAIEFDPGEYSELEVFSDELLSRLVASDFQLVCPGRQTICTIHCRAQLWWTTADDAVAVGLDRILDEHPQANP